MSKHVERVRIDEVLAAHMLTDRGISRSDSDHSALIDGIFPVRHTFEITSVPSSNVAPPNIREQWLGLTLPVRTEIRSYEPAIHVLAVDGLNALMRAGHNEAHQWWQDFYEQNPHRQIAWTLNPFAAKYRGIASRIMFLGFNSRDGELAEVKRRHQKHWHANH